MRLVITKTMKIINRDNYQVPEAAAVALSVRVFAPQSGGWCTNFSPDRTKSLKNR